MSISAENWQDIWNEGYQVGWNDRYHQNHAVTPAPGNVALCISKANWDAIYNSGFDAAYGKHTAAPAPGDVPHDDAVCPPAVQSSPPLQLPIATTANAGPQFGYDDAQWGDLYLVWRIGHDLGAPYLAIQAALSAVMGEGSLGGFVCNGGGYCGLWQVGRSWQTQHDWHDNAYWTTWAYEHGFYGYGGIISIARDHPNYSAGYIANLCQGAYSDLTAGGNYYQQNAAKANQVYNYWQGGEPAPASSPQSAPTQAPTIQSPESAFVALNWSGDFELLFQGMAHDAVAASTSADDYWTRLVAFDYISAKPFGVE